MPETTDAADFTALRHEMYASAQSKGWKELWLTWRERWSEQGARDALIVAMSHFEACYQDPVGYLRGNWRACWAGRRR